MSRLLALFLSCKCFRKAHSGLKVEPQDLSNCFARSTTQLRSQIRYKVSKNLALSAHHLSCKVRFATRCLQTQLYPLNNTVAKSDSQQGVYKLCFTRSTKQLQSQIRNKVSTNLALPAQQHSCKFRFATRCLQTLLYPFNKTVAKSNSQQGV